jgi:hypothetical protein
MADLKHLERRLLEDLLGMGGGWVLDFSDVRYATFFRDFDIDIERQEYHKNGRSKAKRMRAFWELGSNAQVGKVLEGLFQYIDAMNPQGAGGPVEDKHWAIVHRLLGTKKDEPKVAHSEKEFLELEFGKLDLSRLSLGAGIDDTINQRIEEIKLCLVNEVPLAAVLLSGSTLEGLLLDAALKNPQAFNTASAAPRAEGKVKAFHDWSLNDFINVAYEIRTISLDVKKYSHALRDFRNYVHPFQQASSQFNPDPYTAKISWQVLRAAIADLTGKRKR